jgi:carboxyl-terminal processing protease
MTWKKILRFLLAGSLLMVFAGFFQGRGDIYFEISKNMELFGRIYKEISFNYVDEIDPEQFMRAGIQGMLNSLDPYTIFVDESKKGDIDLITNGKYGGVGISIGVRGEKVTVIEVMDGYAAQKQGVRVGDILIEARGISISPENVDVISSLVKGDPGSSVGLRVVRNEDKDTLRFDLIREEVMVKNIPFYGFIPEESNNAYIKLSSFSRSAGDELKKALKDLKEQKEIKSVVLDLRGNPGGLLDVAVDICDKFLEKDQLVVSTRGRDEKGEKKYYSTQEPMVKDAKIVVLINEGSASASEIVAGAIQDHDRGVILGNRSFGKGLVQTITPLNYNTSLKITTAKYYTPSGRSIQKVNYSKGNKVFTNSDSTVNITYFTDNKREVFGNGGILPDTTIKYEIEGNITRELLAKGLFFKFADHYYYTNPNSDFGKLNNNNLFNDFEKYLRSKKFVFITEAEKQIDKLIADIQNKNGDESLLTELKIIKSQFKNIDNGELKIYKKEVIKELRTELAARYVGNGTRIKEVLQGDQQFQTALKVIADEERYRSLLNSLN